MQSSIRKASTGIVSKHVVGKKAGISVTSMTLKPADPPAEGYVERPAENDSPALRRLRLEHWLDLANGHWKFVPEASPDDVEWARRVIPLIMEKGRAKAHKLYGNIAVARAERGHEFLGHEALAGLVRMIVGGIVDGVPIRGPITAMVTFPDGRIRVDRGLRDEGRFLDAIEGADPRRFGRCAVCGDFYYALRVNRTKKKKKGAAQYVTCSKKCAQARRVREWRRNQKIYEYNRKLRSAGLVKA
jgi:hypothetical protein